MPSEIVEIKSAEQFKNVLFCTLIGAMKFLSFLSFVGDFIEAIIFNFISCYLVRRLACQLAFLESQMQLVNSEKKNAFPKISAI